MNEGTRSFCLPALINTKAGVVERNAIGIQTFAIGSVYGDELRREVQHLPKFLLTFPKRLDQLLLLSNIHSRAHESPESPFHSRENAYATHMTNLSIWPHDPFREVEAAMVCQHLLNCLCDELPIFQVYERHIFVYCWRLAVRIKPMNPEQLWRPIFEPISIEGPATNMRNALSLLEVELRQRVRLSDTHRSGSGLMIEGIVFKNHRLQPSSINYTSDDSSASLRRRTAERPVVFR